MRVVENKEVMVVKELMVGIVCNCCGTKVDIKDEYDLKQNLFQEIELNFGYGSNYDGQKLSFSLCENCLSKFIETFEISPEIK